jgi:Archaeal holliday junction resolvase (hjc).
VTNSKQKGSAGERELAAVLREAGFAARRTQQFCGAAPESSDVISEDLPDIHFECKRVEHLNIDKAMEQAIRDAKTRTPVVAHRKNRGQWLITMRLSDFLYMRMREEDRED